MKLLFGADLVPTPITEKAFIEKDHKAVWGDIDKIVKQYDRFIVNVECALTNYEGAIKKFGPNIKASPLCADSIKDFGVTDVMLANNHVFDFGKQGLIDTMEALDRVGLPYAGVGKDNVDCRKIYHIEQDGLKIAIVNVCEHEYSYALANRMGANPYEPFQTMREIRDAKKNADHVIVVYHGGKEHSGYPSPRLLEHMREMILNGASVVLTQHSHCVGCYEEYEGGHIVYGQGNLNFVVDTKRDTWKKSLLVGVEINGKDVKLNFHPIYQTATGMDVATGDIEKDIMDGFYARNEELKNGKWVAGWEAFCKEVEGMYRYMISPDYAIDFKNEEQGKQVFAHFLDCEAHLDVFKHLFPSWNLDNEL
ncbi:MAG: CapA family protein [Clostridia bacterium]|nr:CapA family protein [Clostridia bacterium]